MRSILNFHLPDLLDRFTSGLLRDKVYARNPANPPAFKNQWNIYDKDGAVAFDVDSCLGVKIETSTRVSNFPVEKGGFASYNKATQPMSVRVQLVVAGSNLRISQFITDLKTAADSIELYDVIASGNTFKNFTIEKYDFQRTAERGRNMLVADVSLVEVREVTSSYTTVKLPAPKVKNPKAASKKKDGKTQPSLLESVDKLSIGDVYKKQFGTAFLAFTP